MRIVRLYLPQPLESGTEIVLTGERAHYLLNVLRARPGHPLQVFNGQGGEYGAQLVSADRHRARLKIGSFMACEAESPLRVYLGLAIAKGERMDLSVQKATELGVDSIAPLITARSNAYFPAKAEAKQAHWQKIAIAACEQCGRNRVPTIFPPQPFASWIAACAGGVLLDPGGMPFLALARPKGGLSLLVGPEGGLTEDERQRALEAGFVPACLGPRILRVETAVTAALSLAQALWGDVGFG